MSIIPVIRAAEILRVLYGAGFRIVRQTGSHIILRHFTDAKRQTLVPRHGRRNIPRWLLHEILKQAKISVDDFLKWI
mgnify:CR=1 FL=1